MFTDTGDTLLELNPTVIKQSLPRQIQTVQIAGVSSKHQCIPVSKPIPFHLHPLRDTHPFLLTSFTPILLLGQDFLEK